MRRREAVAVVVAESGAGATSCLRMQIPWLFTISMGATATVRATVWI